jgi:hypothetical protein
MVSLMTLPKTYFGLMLYGFAFVVITLLIILLGVQTFFGYLFYLMGWTMAGSGYHLIGDFYLNSTYLFAIYPLAWFAHLIFWKVFMRVNQIQQGGNINNIIVRIITYCMVAVFFLFIWYVLGHMLMAQALTMVVMSTTLMTILTWMNDSGAAFWAGVILTLVGYVIFFIKFVAVFMRRETLIEKALVK